MTTRTTDRLEERVARRRSRGMRKLATGVHDDAMRILGAWQLG